ncbi:hypothetical protein [Marinicella sp. W31]|uniref:hypothetical protein n=1 Tax=Marinicella sp. W31 TaxID=3023713 RepID=UPI0037582825
MKKFIGLTVLLFLFITDAQAIFCDPSEANPGDTGTISTSKDTKGGQALNRFGNDDCEELTPITVTGFYISFGGGTISALSWALSLPIGAVSINKQTQDDKGCTSLSPSERETIAEAAFITHRTLFVDGSSQLAFLRKWGTGKTWTFKFPDGSIGSYRIGAPLGSDPLTSELSCNG